MSRPAAGGFVPRRLGSRTAKGLLIAVGLSLACAAAADPIASPVEKTVEEVVPGLDHVFIRAGTEATALRYRIVVGTFDYQADADAALARLASLEIPPTAYYEAGQYHIGVDGFPTREEASAMLERLEAGGFPSPSLEELIQDITNPGGPWEIHVLEADPRRVAVEVAHAYDAAIGLETATDLAHRRGALAAVNGGYFLQIPCGDSQGALRIDGTLLSEPDRGRAAVGFFEEDGLSRAVFGRLSFRGRVILADRDEIELAGLNRRRHDDELVLYSPEFHRTTLTGPSGAEVVVRQGRIEAVRDGLGSSEIPPSGFVLSLGADLAADRLSLFRPGDAVVVEAVIVPLLSDPEGEWARARFILGGGPLLLWNGQRIEDQASESISRAFVIARHPRTAAAIRSDGTLLFVTVDGRRPHRSVGMSIPELTDLLLELGAVSAVNLDGGGSTTMVVRGRTVNTPSDPRGEREIADAILLFAVQPQRRGR